MKRVLALMVALVVLFAGPAAAQQKTEKEKEYAKGQVMFWAGLGIASAGLTPLFMGTGKSIAIATPFLAGGGTLAYMGHRKRKKAEQMVFVAPMKRGVAVGFSRTW